MILNLNNKGNVVLLHNPFNSIFDLETNPAPLVRHTEKAEAVVWRCSVEKVFLKILQISQESNCARVSFYSRADVFL